MNRDFWNVDFWQVTKGYIDISSMDMLSNGEYIGTTEEYYDEGLGGFVSFKIYKIDGVEYICSSEGWVFRNP
jgi:hypothetical protein